MTIEFRFSPSADGKYNHSLVHRPLSITSSLVRCRRVFAALVALAVEELVEAADALLAPVRLGVVRPTAPFPLATTFVDLVNGSEDLFGVEPLSTAATRLAHSRRYVYIYFF